MTRESTLSIRRCGPDDWQDLRSIRLEALADTPDAYGSTYDETARWSDAQWKDAATNRMYYLADRDRRVVGMVSGGFNDAHPGTRWLYGMYVTPSERGTGTASLLVDAIGAWATSEGVDEVFLHVTSSVPRARAFYEKIGFRQNGESFSMQRDDSLTLITMVRNIDYDTFHVARVSADQLHELRRRVLRNDDAALYHPDSRDEDESSIHYGGFLGPRLVVSASFFPSAPPMNSSLVTYQLRYMATDFDVQGRGYGARVLAFAEDDLRALGVEQIWANGRDTALGFYESVGWQRVEDSEHLSAETLLPHTVIFKLLAKEE